MDEEFSTEFVNQSGKAWSLYEVDGHLIVQVPPGRSVTMISISALTAYARWSRVTKTPEGQVVLTDRDGFVDPFVGPNVVEFLNAEGKDVEKVVTGDGTSIFLTKDIPVKAFLGPDDPLVKYERVALRIISKRFKAPTLPGVIYTDKVLAPVGEGPRG